MFLKKSSLSVVSRFLLVAIFTGCGRESINELNRTRAGLETSTDQLENATTKPWANELEPASHHHLGNTHWRKLSREIATRLLAIQGAGFDLEFEKADPIVDGYFVGPFNGNDINRSIGNVPMRIADQTGRPIHEVTQELYTTLFEPAIAVLETYVREYSHPLAYTWYLGSLDGEPERMQYYTLGAAKRFRSLIKFSGEILLTVNESDRRGAGSPRH